VSEPIGSASIQLEIETQKLKQSADQAEAVVGAGLQKAERTARDQMAKVQRAIDGLNATKVTAAMGTLSTAVEKMGGVAALSGQQLVALRSKIDSLAAAGAKVPKNLIPALDSKTVGVLQSLGSGGGLTGVLAAIGPAGIAAAAGVGILTGAFTAAVSAVSALAAKAEGWTNTATATGLGVVQVQQLQAYLEDAGFSAEDLQTAMQKLQKEIAGGGDNLAKFGIVIEDIKGMAPEEQLREVARQITNIEDPTNRAAAAMAAFGRSGAEHLAAIAGIASGAYKEIGSLTEAQVKRLAEVDNELDKAGRYWTNWKNEALVALLEVGKSIVNFRGSASMLGSPEAPAAGPMGKLPTSADLLDKSPLFTGNEWADIKKKAEPYEKLQKELQAAAEKSVQERASREEIISKALDSETKYMRDQTNAAEDLAALEKKRIEDLGNEIIAARRSKVDAAAAFGAYQDALEQIEIENATVEKGTESWTDSLGDVANAFQMLGDIAGGVLGGIFNAFGNAAAAGQRMASVIGKNPDGSSRTWSQMNTSSKIGVAAGAVDVLGGAFATGKQKGIGAGMLSGAASGAMAGAAVGALFGGVGAVPGAVIGGVVGAVAGLIGGLKHKDPVKDAMKALGKSMGHGVSEEFAKQVMADAEKWGISLADAGKLAEAKATAEQGSANLGILRSGVGTAKEGAEALMAVMGELTPAAQTAGAALVGAVQGAMAANGLGWLATGALKENKSFQATQGAVGATSQLISGMRTAGGIDTGLLGAAGGMAEALKQQAVAAALATGSTQEEANKIGIATVAPILTEQLNASLASGKELDANTKALIAEAKKNGIDIVADPILQQLQVQRDTLAVLQGMAGLPVGGPAPEPGGGTTPDGRSPFHAASGLGPAIMPDVGGGLGPLIQTHAGEAALIIPRNRSNRRWFIHAAGGLSRDGGEDGGGGRGGHGGGGGTGSGAGAAAPTPEAFAAAVAQTAAAQRPVVVQPVIKFDATSTVENAEQFGRQMDKRTRRLWDDSDFVAAARRALALPP
jgi:hypothetical protein